MTGNNSNLDLVNINVHTNFGLILSNHSRNEILTSVKDHNSVTIVRKMTSDNPNLDLVNFNAYTNFGKILSICSQDIEWKQNYDEWNNRWNDGRVLTRILKTGFIESIPRQN